MPAEEVADELSLKPNSVYRALARIHAVLLKCVREQVAMERIGSRSWASASTSSKARKSSSFLNSRSRPLARLST